MSVNKAILLGRLGGDAVSDTAAGGAVYCKFSMATSEKWTDKSGEKIEKTEWHRIVLWGKLADAIGRYLIKGTQVYVEGSIHTHSWDAPDGTKKYSTEIKADTVRLLGHSKNGAAGQEEEGAGDDGDSIAF
jgi:single-strand DNA-binding protein